MIERYYLKEMKQIWEEENYYRKWRDVEVAVLKARGDETLAQKIKTINVEPEEIRKRENKSGHELNAFLDLLEEKVGDEAGKIHKGLTSSDIMDTARILQIKETLVIFDDKFENILNILKEKAVKYKKLVMCGRTHGQVAEPITLGLKFARFLEFARRNAERIEEAKPRILVGKISGAVGTYSLISPEEEKKVLDYLGLKPLNVAAQIIPRDIFSEYLFIMALISSFAEEIAMEIRLLTQDGIKEVSEPFTSTQTGSSAMPHKKNPVICERICGLARLVKSYVNVGLTNISLWNERDISHSSNERLILEESSSLTYYILDKLEFVLKDLEVHSENIRENLKKAGLRLFSSGILKLLLDNGLGRKKAYSLAKDLFREDSTFAEIKETLKKEAGIKEEDVKKVLDTDYYLSNVEIIFSRLEV